MMCAFFNEVTENESLAAFATLGGLGEAAQQFICQAAIDLITAVLTHWDKVYNAASQHYIGLSSDLIQPYSLLCLFPILYLPFI
jgi:hypothetical protein